MAPTGITTVTFSWSRIWLGAAHSEGWIVTPKINPDEIVQMDIKWDIYIYTVLYTEHSLTLPNRKYYVQLGPLDVTA